MIRSSLSTSSPNLLIFEEPGGNTDVISLDEVVQNLSPIFNQNKSDSNKSVCQKCGPVSSKTVGPGTSLSDTDRSMGFFHDQTFTLPSTDSVRPIDFSVSDSSVASTPSLST